MKPKVYDAATELAIEERIKALLADEPVQWIDHGTYIAIAEPSPVYVEVFQDGERACVWKQIGRWSDDSTAPNVTAGKIDAADDVRSIVRGLRAALSRKNRKLRGKTTKQLKAEAP